MGTHVMSPGQTLLYAFDASGELRFFQESALSAPHSQRHAERHDLKILTCSHSILHQPKMDMPSEEKAQGLIPSQLSCSLNRLGGLKGLVLLK